ncbi:MAG: hypothetical protein ACEROO_08775, partial [Candidatus Bathyarchaeota archaeon]
LKEEKYPVKVPTEEKINIIIGQATPRYATIARLANNSLLAISKTSQGRRRITHHHLVLPRKVFSRIYGPSLPTQTLIPLPPLILLVGV